MHSSGDCVEVVGSGPVANPWRGIRGVIMERIQTKRTVRYRVRVKVRGEYEDLIFWDSEVEAVEE